MAFADEFGAVFDDELTNFFGESVTFRAGGSGNESTVQLVIHQHDPSAERDDGRMGFDKYHGVIRGSISQTDLASIPNRSLIIFADGTEWKITDFVDGGDGTWHLVLGEPVARSMAPTRRLGR